MENNKGRLVESIIVLPIVNAVIVLFLVYFRAEFSLTTQINVFLNILNK